MDETVDVRVQLLGPVRAWRDGEDIALGPAGRRSVFALLGLSAGRPLSSDSLIDALWADRPPPHAANVVQTYIKHIRQALEPDRTSRSRSTLLPRTSSGYVLDVDPDAVDALRFRRLVRQARAARRDGDLDRAAALSGAALALWQARPVADLPQLAGHPLVAALDDDRWAAVSVLCDAALANGTAEEVLSVVQEAAAARPLDESAQAGLIRVYRAAGRRADALVCYERIRRVLADELGVDPGRELRELYDEILREDRSAGRPVAVAQPPVVPAQLPTGPRGFAGRTDPLARLDAILAAAGSEPTSVVVTAVSGTAGVGKTALAVHWAHRVSGHFPDGQLYVNLRGFDPSASALTADEAVCGFLDALGVPQQQMPASLEARIGRYRSLLAGRRVLVVLDNARDAEQVRPLLPGSPGCLVVVTSRNQLTSLVAAEGAHPVSLDLLSAAEAHELLAGRLGAERVAAEPSVVAEIINRCARLPLALTIVAARAATRPRLALGSIAAELREARGELDAFAADDVTTDVRSVLSWSYDALSPPAGTLFRLLALHPGAHLTEAAAASLAGVPVTRVRQQLDELFRAHLVSEQPPDRFSLHDLLRAYATERVRALDSEDTRRAAVRRLLDHYLHTTYHAAMLLRPLRDGLTAPAPAGPEVTPEPLTDHTDALAWLNAERSALVTAVRIAVDAGLDSHGAQLAAALEEYFNRRGHWHDSAAIQQLAVDANRRLDDTPALIRALRAMGHAYDRLSKQEDAQSMYLEAGTLARRIGDHLNQAHLHVDMGGVLSRQGRHAEALAEAEQAMVLLEAGGHLSSLAVTLNNIGWSYVQLGDCRQAIAYCERALALCEQIGDTYNQAFAWDSLGNARHQLGDYEQAVACYDRSVELFSEFGDRYAEGQVLVDRGDTHRAAGNPAAAAADWRRALVAFDELGHLDAEQVRARLDAMPDA